jgi:branched-chain amino acid transport system ATP-binding protein
MDVVRDVSDWVIVMAQGQIVAEGPPGDVMAQQAVIDAYLGAHHDAPLTLEDEEEQLAAAEQEVTREHKEERP